MTDSTGTPVPAEFSPTAGISAPQHLPPAPAWSRHAIVWQVFPLGFVGAPTLAPQGDPDDPSTPAGALAAEHRLLRLVDWLDYLVGLGCNVLALGPVFASMSHGYDTVDYFRIDPRLGTNEDFETLARQAHARGVRLVLDGVFNHVGKDFPAFAALPQAGPGSEASRLFRLTWPEDWQPGTAPDYERFEGQEWLPALNHAEPAVADMVVEVMKFWLERGADAWRLDAAYAVDPAFWTRVLPRVREHYPEAYFVGEVIHGDYVGITAASGMDSVTQYELWKAVWSSIESRNFYELDWALRRHAEFLRSLVPWTFLGNHDTTRIASQISEPAHLPHAVALLATLPGLPAIYYGDEQGYRGVKEDRLGGDDEIRPPFPATPADMSDLGAPTLRLYQDLVGLRRRLPWLHDADLATLHLDNRLYSLELTGRAGWADAGASDGGPGSVVVVLSLEEHEAWVPTAGHHAVLAASPGSAAPRPEGDGVVLPAHAWAVLGTS